jgi:hypothetical protein
LSRRKDLYRENIKEPFSHDFVIGGNKIRAKEGDRKERNEKIRENEEYGNGEGCGLKQLSPLISQRTKQRETQALLQD